MRARRPCAGPIFAAIQALGDKPPYQDRVGDDDVDGTDMVGVA